jgi:hypothetical protein
MHDVLQDTGDLGSQLPLDKLDDVFGDTHAVLYVDDASHLVTRALVDLPLKADGKTFVLHMDFAVTGIDAPVRFPTL